MNYTPGPWLLSHNTNWKTNPFSVTVRKPGVHNTTVANIPLRMTIPPQEQQANARLIAIAPELFEIAKGLLALEHQCKTHGLWMLAVNARAAIAKATGENQ